MGAVDDRRDVLEGYGEQVVEHEGEPLGRAKRLEHKKQRRAHRVGEDRFFFRIGEFGLGPIALSKGLFEVSPAGAEHPQADARYHRGEPSAKVVDALRVRTAQADPRLLHRVLCLGE